VHVQVRGEGGQHDGRVVARVGEGVWCARRNRDPRAGTDVVVVRAHGEPHGAGQHVEAFVVLGVPVLRGTGGVRRNGDFADPQAVFGVAAVFEDAHLCRAVGEELAFAGPDDRYSDHEKPPDVVIAAYEITLAPVTA
jgi:hypothetical protein